MTSAARPCPNAAASLLSYCAILQRTLQWHARIPQPSVIAQPAVATIICGVRTLPARNWCTACLCMSNTNYIDPAGSMMQTGHVQHLCLPSIDCDVPISPAPSRRWPYLPSVPSHVRKRPADHQISPVRAGRNVRGLALSGLLDAAIHAGSKS